MANIADNKHKQKHNTPANHNPTIINNIFVISKNPI